MSISASKKAIQQSVEVYEKLLSGCPEELFTRTPAEGVWSYSEVFAHIFRSNIGCCKAIEGCAAGTGIEDTKPLSVSIKLILFFKRLPPGKYKVPQVIAKDVQKISRKEAEELIARFKAKMETVYPLVSEASPTQKVKHPRLGLFNAKDWYAFIHIHTLRHQRQLGRIGKLHSTMAS